MSVNDIDLSPVRYAIRGIRGRYREDVEAEGRLALVLGSQAGLGGTDLIRLVHDACRKAARRERAYDSRIAFMAPRISSDRRQHSQPDLWAAMRMLSERQYEAVVLVYWGGMSQEEAATEMGITQQAVDLLLKRSEGRLRNILEGHCKTRPLDACIK